jgi:hypothetical protein
MNDMRAIFLPVLEQAGVDLILTGHSHVYERSWLIDGHYGKSATFDKSAHVKQATDGRADGTGVYRKPRARTPARGEVSVVTGSAGHAGGKNVPLNHPVFFLSSMKSGRQSSTWMAFASTSPSSVRTAKSATGSAS